MAEDHSANWPDCVIDGCPNKCCLALDSIFCFPHTPGNEHVKRMKIDAINYAGSWEGVEALERAGSQ